MIDRAALPGPEIDMQVGACFISGRIFDLDRDEVIALDDARSFLSDDERVRADRFHFERHRARFTRGRGFLRQTLAHLLGESDPAGLDIVEGPYGKPMLLGDPIGFNLSHSESDAVLIWSQDGAVGVDLERHDRTVNIGKLAGSVFTDEEFALLEKTADHTERRKMFFDFWTAKEARMKLTGEGMTLNPKKISLVLKAGKPFGFRAPSQPKTALRYISGLEALSCAVVARAE